jgi:hypothetical protein
MRPADVADKSLDLVNWRGCRRNRWSSVARCAALGPPGQCFYGATDYGLRSSVRSQIRKHRCVSVDYEYRAQAQAAMKCAVAATCERERLEWVSIALASHDLAPPRVTLERHRGCAAGALCGVGSRLRPQRQPSLHPSGLVPSRRYRRHRRRMRNPRKAITLFEGSRSHRCRLHPPAA